MFAPRRHTSAFTRGFALPVVLLGLIAITALFTATNRDALANVAHQSAEAVLAEGALDRHSLLTAAAHQWNHSQPVQTMSVQGAEIEIRDVAGLIDLNTASRPLLEALFDALELDPSQKNAFYTWRASGRRVLRVEDLARIVGADLPTEAPDIHRLATVRSGRTGLDPQSVTPELLELLGLSSLPAHLVAQRTASAALVYSKSGQEWLWAGAISIRDGAVRITAQR